MEEDSKEPWYECEECEVCLEEAKQNNVEYEHQAPWDPEQSSWVCDNCGGFL